MDTLTAARSRDPSVRMADVRGWLRKHGERLLGCGLTGGAYDVRKPETIIADAYEKSKADGNTTARSVHNRAKDLLSEHLHRQGLNKRDSKVSAAEVMSIDDVREWLKKRTDEPKPVPTAAASSSSSSSSSKTPPPAPPPPPPEPEAKEPEPKAEPPESAEPDTSWTKDQIIEHYYNVYSNIGNVEKTWKQAREVDRSITRKDVQDWTRRNYAPLRAHRGLNSYVAKQPREEYQMDIMFLKDLEKEIGQEKPLYEGALLMVDIFTKYCWAEPIIGKDTKYIKKAITKCMVKMSTISRAPSYFASVSLSRSLKNIRSIWYSSLGFFAT